MHVPDLNWNAVFGFWLVARHGSFAEAVRAMPRGSTQALHKRVRQLEGAGGLNLKLLRSRGVKGVELTEAGRRLQQLLTPVFESFGRMAVELRDENRGSLLVATTGFAARNYIPDLVRAFRKRFSRVSVGLHVRNEAEVIALVENGRVDLGVGAAPPAVKRGARRVEVAARAALPVKLIVPRRHPLTRELFGWADVVREPLIVHERVSVLRRALEHVLSRENLLAGLQVAAECTTPELCVEMVRAGFGIALAPLGPGLVRELHGLATLDPPAGLPQIDIGVLYRRDRYLPRYARVFVEFAAALLPRLTGGALAARHSAV